jgi:dolichol-phosphate mannosyltransferase
MQVSVVIPVHNESANIVGLLDEVDKALSDFCDYEIVVVDDGSSDSTPQVLESTCERLSSLRVLHHEKCCGQSTALITGVLAADYPIVCTLDGDGQNDPADLPRMLEALTGDSATSDLAMVAGYRKKRRDSRWRLFCSRVANGVRRKMLSDNTPDSGCGIKVFYRQTFMSMPHFDHMHRFLPCLAQRTGATVTSVEVNHRPRVHGKSHYGTLGRLMVGIIDLAGVAWLVRRNKFPVVSIMEASNDLRSNMDNSRASGSIHVYRPVRRSVA